MKSPESVDMAQLTAFVTSLSQGVNSIILRLGLAAVLAVFGLYLYLIPNQITVSRAPDITWDKSCG